MHNVFIFVNLHLNDFIGHLVNNKYWIVGSWSMLKFWLYLIFCEIESFILKIYKWPYIDEYEDIKLKRTWIYVLIWLFIMIFMNIHTWFWVVKLHHLKNFIKNKMFFVGLKKGQSFIFHEDWMWYVWLFAYMMNMFCYILGEVTSIVFQTMCQKI
jgi:hypothetical protein